MVLKGDCFHYTVKSLPNHHNPPNECTYETAEDALHTRPMIALPPRDVGSTGEPVPGSRLEVGQQVETEALIQKCWNTVGIAVQKGQLYDVSATGICTDKDHQSTEQVVLHRTGL